MRIKRITEQDIWSRDCKSSKKEEQHVSYWLVVLVQGLDILDPKVNTILVCHLACLSLEF